MKYLVNILKTDEDLKLFLLRIVVGVAVFAHGAQKLLGWFGGHGLQWYIENFGQWFGFPEFVTVLVIAADFFGSLMLLTGIFTRFAAACVSLVMFGAIYFVHGRWGFFMNWYSEPRGEGFEFHLLVLAITIVLVIGGAGKFSVDRLIIRRVGNV